MKLVKEIREYRSRPILLLALGLATAACSPDMQGEQPVIASGVFIVPAPACDVATVSEMGLVFPSSQADALGTRTPGDILVGQPSRTIDGANPFGFLRRLKLVEHDGDQIVLQTEPADLEDVFVEGHLYSSHGLFDSTLQPQDTGGLAGGEFDFSATVLDTAGLGVTISFTQGHVSFNPLLEFDAHFSKGKVKDVTISAGGSLDAALAVKAEATASLQATLFEKTVVEAPPVVFLEFVGPVPVVVVGSLSIAVSCELAEEGSLSLEVGATTSSSIAVGAQYAGGKWSPISTTDFSFAPIGPNLESNLTLKLRCAVVPEVALKLYDVAGPYLALSTPYAEFELDADTVPAPYVLRAGADGYFGGKVEILGKTLAEAQLKLFDVSAPLVTGTLPGGPACSDGQCNGGENCSSCPQDCGACPALCPDGQCNGGENCSSCPQDCGACPASCPDGQCNAGENCSSCPQDCGACPASCPDGQCNGGENCSSCPQDCGACPASCPDGQCNGGENCSSCPQDCGACPPSCGDGQCSGGENCPAACCGDCATKFDGFNSMKSCVTVPTGSATSYNGDTQSLLLSNVVVDFYEVCVSGNSLVLTQASASWPLGEGAAQAYTEFTGLPANSNATFHMAFACQNGGHNIQLTGSTGGQQTVPCQGGLQVQYLSMPGMTDASGKWSATLGLGKANDSVTVDFLAVDIP